MENGEAAVPMDGNCQPRAPASQFEASCLATGDFLERLYTGRRPGIDINGSIRRLHFYEAFDVLARIIHERRREAAETEARRGFSQGARRAE
jgi:hypothetical protein